MRKYGVVLALAAIFSLPVVWVLITSIKKQSEYAASPIVLFPAVPQWINYQLAVTMADFPKYATNSLFLSSAYTILVVITSGLLKSLAACRPHVHLVQWTFRVVARPAHFPR